MPPKIIINIHPPKNPKNRKPLRLKLRRLAKKNLKRKMAKTSRKLNRP